MAPRIGEVPLHKGGAGRERPEADATGGHLELLHAVRDALVRVVDRAGPLIVVLGTGQQDTDTVRPEHVDPRLRLGEAGMARCGPGEVRVMVDNGQMLPGGFRCFQVRVHLGSHGLCPRSVVKPCGRGGEEDVPVALINRVPLQGVLEPAEVGARRALRGGDALAVHVPVHVVVPAGFDVVVRARGPEGLGLGRAPQLVVRAERGAGALVVLDVAREDEVVQRTVVEPGDDACRVPAAV